MPPAHKPPVLSDADITSTTLTLTAAWKADRRLWADNGVLCIIPVEYLNLLPFVVRVMHRMVSRRRFLNISEAVFFWMWVSVARAQEATGNADGMPSPGVAAASLDQ